MLGDSSSRLFIEHGEKKNNLSLEYVCPESETFLVWLGTFGAWVNSDLSLDVMNSHLYMHVKFLCSP